MTTRKNDKFLQYGISAELAEKAVSMGLSVSKVRSLSQDNLVNNFGLSCNDAKVLSTAIKRAPIDPETLSLLLEHSNYVCNVCKGIKSKSYLVHHIEPYEVSQNNSYDNLIVICPADHDLAHQGGLTLTITPAQLKKAKKKWEKYVEIANVQKAARAVDIVDGAIDYINVKRIEELCMNLFSNIPQTNYTDHLKAAGILDKQGTFDQKNVTLNISNGRYLFDYMNHGESLHYKELLENIVTRVSFEDLDNEAEKGFLALKNLEGKNAFFIGGIHAKSPKLPIGSSTPPIRMHYKRKNLRFEWILDAQYLYSMSAIARIGGTNRYIIYCLVRTVIQSDSGEISINASPYLIAQPTAYVHKKPDIAYIKEYEGCVERGLVDEDGSLHI